MEVPIRIAGLEMKQQSLQIQSFAITDAEGVILDIDYDNMGVFRTEVTSSLVPGLVIDVDSQTVWAIADMEVSVADIDGNPIKCTIQCIHA